jgi:hypothetical protein
MVGQLASFVRRVEVAAKLVPLIPAIGLAAAKSSLAGLVAAPHVRVNAPLSLVPLSGTPQHPPTAIL